MRSLRRPMLRSLARQSCIGEGTQYRPFPRLRFKQITRLKSTGIINNSAVATDGPVDIPTALWYNRLGPVSDFFSWFHKKQVKRPLTVQLCTTLTTYFLGDILAQTIGGEEYDPLRTLRMLTIGGLASLPGYKWSVALRGCYPN